MQVESMVDFVVKRHPFYPGVISRSHRRRREISWPLARRDYWGSFRESLEIWNLNAKYELEVLLQRLPTFIDIATNKIFLFQKRFLNDITRVSRTFLLAMILLHNRELLSDRSRLYEDHIYIINTHEELLKTYFVLFGYKLLHYDTAKYLLHSERFCTLRKKSE